MQPMKPTEPSDVHAAVASSAGPLVVCFLKESGCPNCTQTKPALEAAASANPGVPFLSVTVADGAGVTPGFQFRTFPGVFSFVGGKLLRASSGLRTARQIGFLFSRPNDLKVAAYDALEASRFIERELSEYGQGCGYEAPVPAAHVTPAAMPPEGDPNEAACDSCV